MADTVVHTPETVTAQMQADISAANIVTGRTDTTVHDAVTALIAGFGSGGGSSGSTSGIYMAKFTPETDRNTFDVVHNLGTSDILFAACWAETLGSVVPTFNGAVGKYWAKSDIPLRLTASSNGENLVTYNAYNTTNKNATGGVPTSNGYVDTIVDDNTFKFRQAGSATAKYIAGVTYTVIIIAASAFPGV